MMHGIGGASMDGMMSGMSLFGLLALVTLLLAIVALMKYLLFR